MSDFFRITYHSTLDILKFLEIYFCSSLKVVFLQDYELITGNISVLSLIFPCILFRSVHSVSGSVLLPKLFFTT